MRVSILMPVFDAGSLLEACLESILAQTHADWELLAVDDHSTDGSRHLLEAYARRDERIRVLTNVGKGIVPALRLAYRHSSAPLVTRMDADDRMAPQKLRTLHEMLLAEGPGAVATGGVAYFSHDKPLEAGFRRYADWLNRLAATGRHFEEIYRECVLPSPCWMAWRSDLARIGAFETDTTPEDYDLCFRMRAGGLRIVSTPEVLHHWCDHPRRASRNLPEYKDQTFLDLKVRWFLKIDYQPTGTLVLWGAGRKGKRIARLLREAGVSFRWVCQTPSKWGQHIGSVRLEPPEVLSALPRPQVIVAVAAHPDQRSIEAQLSQLGLHTGSDFFFFA